METGRNTTVDIRHTLTQFGDWSGPSRQLSSTCTQDTVVWVPIWRGLAFQTLPFVSADKPTKPQTTFFSPAQNMPRDVSYHGCRMLIWRPSCGARQKTSTGRLVLWHQPGLKIWPARLSIAEEEELMADNSAHRSHKSLEPLRRWIRKGWVPYGSEEMRGSLWWEAAMLYSCRSVHVADWQAWRVFSWCVALNRLAVPCLGLHVVTLQCIAVHYFHCIYSFVTSCYCFPWFCICLLVCGSDGGGGCGCIVAVALLWLLSVVVMVVVVVAALWLLRCFGCCQWFVSLVV